MSRGRKLSETERALWQRVTRDVVPSDAPTRGPRGTEPSAMGDLLAEGPAAAPMALPPSRPAMARPASLSRRHYASTSVSALGAGDPGHDKRLQRARHGAALTSAGIDRVLDLHGMTEAQAYAAFASTLRRAFDQYEHCMLVITGKGGPASASAMAHRRHHGRRDEYDPHTDGDRSPRGVLRRRFLEWIDEPSLRPMIARASQAKPRDGGAGAFYVFLKKNRPR